MRIVLAHSHANTFGGGERAVLEVARVLEPEHDVRLALGGFDVRQTYPELASFPIERFGRARWPLAHVDADAIVTNSFGANLLALRNGERVAYWVHSTRSIFLGREARRVDLRARRLLDWLAVRRAAQVIANSRYTAARVWRLYHREPDAVVYPGVDLEAFQPAAVVRDGYAITVGRISTEKGLDRLLAVWRDLPDLPLHVVGDGAPDVVARLRQQAPPNVVWRGRLTGEGLTVAVQGAAVAVFAAYGEEFGMAPLEAMACGVPVVAWRDGGLAETVVEGETGFLVDDDVTFRQRVRLLLHDLARRDHFAHAARARAAEFTWERTAAGIVAACHRLARQPVRAPSG